jgi:hypothetical protein
MPALTRSRDRNLPQESWRVYCGDVHAGTIVECGGNLGAVSERLLSPTKNSPRIGQGPVRGGSARLKKEFQTMADDPVQDLMNARTALINERRSTARTIAIPGARTDQWIRSFIEIQQALEAINRAITDEKKKKAATGRKPGF